MEINQIKWAEIDLDKLAYNVKQIRKLVGPEVKIAAVVKANGYGHGSMEICGVLLESGADMIAVSSINEAVEIRKEYKKAQTIVLGYIPTENIEEAIQYGVIQTVISYDQAKIISIEAEKFGMGVSVHIKIDTGMNRIGFYPDAASILEIMAISKLPNIKINGIYSHFAVADERDKSFTHRQFEQFTGFVSKLEAEGLSIPIKHISNSAGVLDMPDMNLSMVRPGIILYGVYPSNQVDRKALDLKPVMTLKARIAFIKTLQEDGGISYGHAYMGKKGQRIATIPIGYADGYTRLLSNVGEVLVKGQKTHIVGTICMDQCMIDITDIDHVQVGDEVVLFGTDGTHEILVEDVAEKCGKISYELLCNLGRRVPRVYLKNGQVVKTTNYLE
jgi:alanine racemase